MRHIRVVLVLFFSLVLIWDARADAQTRATTTGTREDTSGGGTVEDKSFDPGTIAKTIDDEVSRLKNDAIEWGQKLQELEADLKNNENVDGTVKDVDESLVVVRAAADRLAPNTETRVTLRKQEEAIRDLAIRAEVHSDRAIRKTAGYFQQKTAELHAVNRSLEEIRIRLVTEIDRLQELKVRFEFNPAAAQNREALKEAEVNLNHVNALAADAQQLASDLNNFGGTVPVAATPSDATKPADVRYVRVLDEIKRDYGKISHPSEAARAYYITRLVRLHEEVVRLKTDAWQAIDAEIKQHPAPNDSNSKALSSLLVGKWKSPRHDHLYRADGTWTMIPVEPDVTHGTWRIEGNQYFNTYIDTDASHSPQTFQYTIILITKRDFIFTDQEAVFYETRLK